MLLAHPSLTDFTSVTIETSLIFFLQPSFTLRRKLNKTVKVLAAKPGSDLVDEPGIWVVGYPKALVFRPRDYSVYACATQNEQQFSLYLGKNYSRINLTKAKQTAD
jgi:hypothetical protein